MVMDRFSPSTREWFTGTFAEPTPAQAQAWSAIADGDNTLVIEIGRASCRERV